MSVNPYKRLLGILAGAPLDVGEVVGVSTDGVTVQLVGGGLVHARGEAAVGEHVYVRGGVIEGPAPALTGIDQEV